MQKLLRDKCVLPSPTSTGARCWSRASSSSAPPGMHFSGEQRQQQEHKKYSQVHYYLEEFIVNKENNDFSTFKLRFRLFFLHNDLGLYSHWRKPCLVPCMTSSYFFRQSLSYPTSRAFLSLSRVWRDQKSFRQGYFAERWTPSDSKFSDWGRKLTEPGSTNLGSFNRENRPETWFIQFPNPSESFGVLQFVERQMQNAEWLWCSVITVRKLSESGFI